MASTINEVYSPLTLPLSAPELPGLWEVGEWYRIWRGSLVRFGGGQSRYYRPQDSEELPFVIAKLAAADEADILRFAHQWGNLGYSRLRHGKLLPPMYYLAAANEERDEHIPGDPIDWIRHHAQNLALCLSIVEGLPGGNKDDIVRAVQSYVDSVRMPTRLALESVTALVFFSDDNPPELHPVERALAERPLEQARMMLDHVVSDHIRGITPYLSLEKEDGGPGIRFRFTAMIELAYLHVARLVQERSQIDRCEECGAIFKKKHGLQRFCSPGQFESESRCSSRQRYRRFKSRKERKP